MKKIPEGQEAKHKIHKKLNARNDSRRHVFLAKDRVGLG